MINIRITYLLGDLCYIEAFNEINNFICKRVCKNGNENIVINEIINNLRYYTPTSAVTETFICPERCVSRIN